MKNQLSSLPIATYRSQRYHLITIFSTLIVATMFSLLFEGIDIYSTIFIEETENNINQTINGISLAVISMVGSFIIAFFIKKHKNNIIKIIFSVSLLITTTLLSMFLGLIITEYFYLKSWVEVIITISGLILGILSIMFLIYNKGGQIIKNSTLIAVSLITGISFGLFLGEISFIIVIIIISIFDIYSVFKGPINSILNNIENTKQMDPHSANSTSKSSSIVIGIGDFIFYIALASFTAFRYGLYISVISDLLIVLGVWLIIQLVYKQKRFPGLPIPVFLVLLVIALRYFTFYILRL